MFDTTVLPVDQANLVDLWVAFASYHYAEAADRIGYDEDVKAEYMIVLANQFLATIRTLAPTPGDIDAQWLLGQL
jgi:hypothetical protein